MNVRPVSANALPIPSDLPCQSSNCIGFARAAGVVVNWPASPSPIAALKRPLLLHGARLAVLSAYAVLLSFWDVAHVSHWALAAVFVAAFVSSIAGFAFSALCGAMLFHLVDEPVRVVGIMMICSTAGQALMTWSVWRDIEWRRLPPVLGGAAIGLPLGIHVLLNSGSGAYIQVIGGLLALYATFMIFHRRSVVIRRQHAIWDGIVGFLGGVTGGAAAFPGAFVTIWYGFKGWSKERQRGCYQPYILIVQVAGLAILATTMAKTQSLDFVLQGIAYVPAALLGTLSGLACFRLLNDRQFALSVKLLLIVSGASLLL